MSLDFGFWCDCNEILCQCNGNQLVRNGIFNLFNITGFDDLCRQSAILNEHSEKSPEPLVSPCEAPLISHSSPAKSSSSSSNSNSTSTSSAESLYASDEDYQAKTKRLQEETRRRKNKEAAQASRDRRKREFEEMREKIKMLEEENDKLKRENTSLKEKDGLPISEAIMSGSVGSFIDDGYESETKRQRTRWQ